MKFWKSLCGAAPLMMFTHPHRVSKHRGVTTSVRKRKDVAQRRTRNRIATMSRRRNRD